jgi:hypothetical protein
MVHKELSAVKLEALRDRSICSESDHPVTGSSELSQLPFDPLCFVVKSHLTAEIPQPRFLHPEVREGPLWSEGG